MILEHMKIPSNANEILRPQCWFGLDDFSGHGVRLPPYLISRWFDSRLGY